MKKLSVKERMLKVLTQSTSNTFTVKQAEQKFGIKNVPARIRELREEGYCIYTNPKKASNGRTVNEYRLGAPTKSLVRAALRSGFSFADVGTYQE